MEIRIKTIDLPSRFNYDFKEIILRQPPFGCSLSFSLFPEVLPMKPQVLPETKPNITPRRTNLPDLLRCHVYSLFCRRFLLIL